MFVKENTDVDTEELTNNEKFQKVVEVLYERCANEEISVGEREKLIAKAKEMFS